MDELESELNDLLNITTDDSANANKKESQPPRISKSQVADDLESELAHLTLSDIQLPDVSDLPDLPSSSSSVEASSSKKKITMVEAD